VAPLPLAPAAADGGWEAGDAQRPGRQLPFLPLARAEPGAMAPAGAHERNDLIV
jgi:hypothetical protein